MLFLEMRTKTAAVIEKIVGLILVQHIKTVLTGLKARISTALVFVAQEHASYGEITESKFSLRRWTSVSVMNASNECELYMVFNFKKVHKILDNIILGGQVIEISSSEVMKAVEEISSLVARSKRS